MGGILSVVLKKELLSCREVSNGGFNIFIKNLGTKTNILLTQFTDNKNLEDKNSTE